MDVVFGNLRNYFTDEVLKYSDRCLENGHISLWKNNQKMNSMFKYYEREGGRTMSKCIKARTRFILMNKLAFLQSA